TPPTSFPVDSIDDPSSRIAKQAITLGAALVLLLSLVVVIRGLLGALEAPASATFPVLAAAIAELLASAFRLLWSRLYPDATRWRTLLARHGIPSICVVCVAVSLSLTQTTGGAVGSLWLVVLAGEIAWWYPEMRLWRPRSAERLATVVVEAEPPEVTQEDSSRDEEESALHVIQQMTRSRNDEGVDVISGVLRAEFAPGERTHNLHVAFCPPLMYEPRIVTHQLDGSPLIVKVAQAECFGTTIYFEVSPR
ncbi:MAG: hypothetical protein HYV60_05100, partial [Planctomycetia bacterium]|nr:hypothetical protein [Planctomycetia bacterium]